VVNRGEETFQSANLASPYEAGQEQAMTKIFSAEVITRSNFNNETSRLEIALADSTGSARTLSLGPDAIAALAEIVAGLPVLTGNHLTKIPKRYAVGHGRHEPVVMIRFEDEPAYGLSVTQAAALAEALLEEAEAVSDTMYCMRQ
jgi:hypothetical protein